jgi:protein-S-isoprenylcysteine O-methyltransferase Ste14
MKETTTERDAARVRMFPPGVPVLAVFAGIALDRVWPIDIGGLLGAPARYWVGGAIIVAANLVLGMPAVIRMRRSGQSENPWKPTTSIVDRGPYRFSRNPMYLQLLLATFGAAVMLMNAWIALLIPVAMWVLVRMVIRPEEAYLERKFGESYLSYKRRVRRWI